MRVHIDFGMNRYKVTNSDDKTELETTSFDALLVMLGRIFMQPVYLSKSPFRESADKQALKDIAIVLETGEREGAETDEPEGARYIKMSHTLAMQLAGKIRRAAE